MAAFRHTVLVGLGDLDEPGLGSKLSQKRLIPGIDLVALSAFRLQILDRGRQMVLNDLLSGATPGSEGSNHACHESLVGFGWGQRYIAVATVGQDALKDDPV